MGGTESRGQGRGTEGSPTALVVGLVSRAQAEWLRPRPWLSLGLASALYALVVLLAGDRLRISSNYLVIFPVIVAALAFGLGGGLLAGALGLPANLLLFALLGHPEFSPASKLMAELAGLTVGFFFGALSDYFEEIEAEMGRRRAVEEALRRALADKEILLRELNHRVRNNLGVVKGLVRLQRGRSDDPRFVAAADELVGRIFAIALVHEELDTSGGCLAVDLGRYLGAIASSAASRTRCPEPRVEIGEGARNRGLPVDTAVHLGLIVNEALVGALLAARRLGGGEVLLGLDVGEGRYLLEVRGPLGVFSSSAADESLRLGLKLMESLSTGLGAELLVGGEEGGGDRVKLSFPEPQESCQEPVGRETGEGAEVPGALRSDGAEESLGPPGAAASGGSRPVLPPNPDRDPRGALGGRRRSGKAGGE